MTSHETGATRRRRRPRESRESAERRQAQDRFLEALAAGRSVRAACHASGLPRSVAYRWRAEDSTFAGRWESALEDAADVVEDTILEHALAGDARLLLALARVLRPGKWAGSSDTAVRVIASASASSTATAATGADIDWSVLGVEELETLASLLDQAQARTRDKRKDNPGPT